LPKSGTHSQISSLGCYFDGLAEAKFYPAHGHLSTAIYVRHLGIFIYFNLLNQTVMDAFTPIGSVCATCTCTKNLPGLCE
jgi:hypothetical protein